MVDDAGHTPLGRATPRQQRFLGWPVGRAVCCAVRAGARWHGMAQGTPLRPTQPGPVWRLEPAAHADRARHSWRVRPWAWHRLPTDRVLSHRLTPRTRRWPGIASALA